MQYHKKILFLIFLLSLISCMKDDELWKKVPPQKVDVKYKGLFIINEGNFMYGNASLSYYDIENKKIYNNIFYNTNAIPLGDVAYSMQIRDSLAYIIINNSGKIYVININNFKLVGKITGLTSPRNIFFIDKSTAYVSDLYAKEITIINPQNFSITGEINVNNGNSEFYQHSTEQMIKYKNDIFVNCWSYDNKILIINSKTNSITDSISVTKQPNSMVLDKNNKLWVLSDGGLQGSSFGHDTPALTMINPETHKIEKIIKFHNNDKPSELTINGSKDTIFFLNKDVYFMSITASKPEIFIKNPYGENYFGGFYGLTVDSTNSDIYVADAIDFVQNGTIYRYKSDKSPLDTFKVGIIPSNFCFKK